LAQLGGASVPDNPRDVTDALIAHAQGDRKTEADLLARIYGELRRLAAWHLKREGPGHTLQPTALVHEAYLRLINDRKTDWEARTKFLALAALQMRRVLVDHHRRKRASKRFEPARRVTLPAEIAVTPDGMVDALVLNQALERLADLDERRARVVQCRFFAGLSVKETAEALGIAERTVKKDWTLARAWLARELRHRPEDTLER
jgi:RNA polymerase sigma factor (TIGR02999 family)